MTQTLKIYQVDAFTDAVFGGNPAAVIPLTSWLCDDTLLNIAIENNLSETAFFTNNDDGSYHLRWFTPGGEVDLCGHATLATAYVIFEQLNHASNDIRFTGLSGDLFVSKTAQGIKMDFPAWSREETLAPQDIINALGKAPTTYFNGPDCMATYESATDIKALTPDFSALKKCETARGIIATAPADKDSELDFVSRCFFPRLNIDEDPVTGSAHCMMVPYWAEQMNKTTFKARQISARGGDLHCTLNGKRVELIGKAVLYMVGEAYVP